MRLNDAAAGVLLILFGTAVALMAWRFPATGGPSIGPGLFPILSAGGIAACGMVLVGRGRREPAETWFEWEAWVRRPRMVLNAALVILALIFYVLAADTMGFFLTGFTFLAVLFLAFDVRRRWIAPLAALVTLGLHVVFYSLLRVPLPWGWLEGMAW